MPVEIGGGDTVSLFFKNPLALENGSWFGPLPGTKHWVESQYEAE